MMKRFAVILLKGIIRFFALFPLQVHYFWAGILAWIFRNCLRYRRDVVMVNLARSFPEKRYGELRSLADEYYTHLAEVIVETIWFAGATPERLCKSGIVRVSNPEVMAAAFSGSRSVEVLYSHCGNWELLGGIETYFSLSLSEGEPLPVREEDIRIVYKKLTSYVWNEFLKSNRIAPTRDFQGLVESAQLLRFMLRHKEDRFVYVLNVDQSPYAGAGAYDIGAFLSQPTKAALGPAELAHKLGLGVVFMRFDRVSRGHYELTFIPICDDASQMKPAYIIRKFYDLLEQEIRENPVNWLWSHRRWKQRTDVMKADLDNIRNKPNA